MMRMGGDENQSSIVSLNTEEVHIYNSGSKVFISSIRRAERTVLASLDHRQKVNSSKRGVCMSKLCQPTLI